MRWPTAASLRGLCAVAVACASACALPLEGAARWPLPWGRIIQFYLLLRWMEGQERWSMHKCKMIKDKSGINIANIVSKIKAARGAAARGATRIEMYARETEARESLPTLLAPGRGMPLHFAEL